MKLRTSFFDTTVFRKNITRFAPLWALYFIGGLLIMLTISDNDTAYYAASNIGETIGPLAVVNIIYAALVAQVLFGDLYNSRLCNALHAMPLRRENWFITHVVSGLCFSLIPNAVGIFFVMFRLQEYWFVASVWLLGMMLQYVFFFGLAVLCVMLAGNRIAMAAFYSIINFASMLVAGFCELVYIPMMYGVELSAEGFMKFCPVVEVARNYDLLVWARESNGGSYVRYFDGFGAGWGYLAVLAVLGVGLMALALVLYRRRSLECAGDFIAVRALGPVFSVVFSLCVGALFALFGEAVDNSYMPFLILGVVVGWFVGRMLLARTVKVFRIKEFLCAAGVMAALFVSILLVQLDVFGIVGWTPDSQQVKSVVVANYRSSSYYVTDLLSSTSLAEEVTDPETIEKVITAHEDILARKAEKDAGGKWYVTLEYRLANGTTVRRSYSTYASGVNYDILYKEILFTEENVLGYESWDYFVKNVDYLVIDNMQVAKDRVPAMLEALRQDFRDGYISFNDKGNETMGRVEYHVQLNDTSRSVYRYLSVSKGARVLQMMEEPLQVLGFASVKEMIKELPCIFINETFCVQGEALESFAEALFADCENGSVSTQYPERVLLKLRYGQEIGMERYLYVSTYAQHIESWLWVNYPEEMAAGAFG